MNTFRNDYINNKYCCMELKGKKAKTYIQKYVKSTATSIAQVYKSYSRNKDWAELGIMYEMEELNGYGYRITGYNCNFFSCAYRAVIDDFEYLIVHTPTYRYLIKLRYIE